MKIVTQSSLHKIAGRYSETFASEHNAECPVSCWVVLDVYPVEYFCFRMCKVSFMTVPCKWLFLQGGCIAFQKYVAVGELGKATDTLDATGSVVLEKDFGKY